jgi:hypothetical protein
MCCTCICANAMEDVARIANLPKTSLFMRDDVGK